MFLTFRFVFSSIRVDVILHIIILLLSRRSIMHYNNIIIYCTRGKTGCVELEGQPVSDLNLAATQNDNILYYYYKIKFKERS